MCRSDVNVTWHGSYVARMCVTLNREVSGPDDQIGEISFDGIDRFDL